MAYANVETSNQNKDLEMVYDKIESILDKSNDSSNLKHSKYAEIEIKSINRSPLFTGNEDTEENRRRYCYNLCMMCSNCEKFYSYDKNPPFVRQSGESACRACILNATDENNRESLPLIINKDLDTNNSVILNTILYSDGAEVMTKTLSKDISTSKNIFQKIEDDYNLNLRLYTLKKTEVHAFDYCKYKCDLFKDALINIHCLRSNLGISHPDENLKEALRIIKESMSSLKKTMKDLDNTIWTIFSCLMIYDEFQIALNVVNFAYPEFSTTLIDFYSYDRKNEQYRELKRRNNGLFITKASKLLFVNKRNLIIIDHETLDLRYPTSGVIFRMKTGDIIIHFSRNTSITQEIASLSTSTKENRFVYGYVSVESQNIVIRIHTANKMKDENKYELLEILKEPYRGMVSVSKVDDCQLCMTIHSKWDTGEFYSIGYIEDENFPLLSIGRYILIGFGVIKSIKH